MEVTVVLDLPHSCLILSLQKDKNVKLDESLTRVQQENENLKARMDRHAALSR